VIVMVGEKDLGSSLLFFMLFVVMLWVATEKTSYLVVGLSMFAVGAVIAYNMFDHVRDRVEIWLDPWSQYSGKGYQVVQGMFAFGAGGYTGSGLGKGFPTRIPAAQNDFIFAAIGEELGLLGCTAILTAFVLLIGAGLRTASRTQRPFEQLLATGLIIIGGVLRVVPLTGVALPFVSYGGSSLVANYVLLAILVRISDGAARQVGDAPDTLTLSERWELRKLRKAANEPAN
jgi:peptidoglycan glycosyltransferase